MADLLKAISKKDIGPLYFLVGERYPQELVVSALKQAVLGGEENDFNFESLSAQECDANTILSASRTIPMLGGMRMVLVREMHRMKAPELTKLLPYIKDPSPSTCLVMLADKVDARLKFFVQFKKYGVWQKNDALKDRQVAKWLGEEAQRRKITLKPGAAQRIAECVGTDMGRLATSLEQLSLYVGPGKPIRPEAVEELLARTREHSIFELTNAVGRGGRRDALQILQSMLEARESGVMIVSMLARHVRQLWSVKELSARGLPQDAVARQVGMHPYFVKDMVRQARRIRTKTLRRMHRALFEADRSLKSSKLPDQIILEQLVMSLCPARP